MNKILSVLVAALGISGAATAQTAASLFWRTDSLQVSELRSPQFKDYKKVGTHGPAVENTHNMYRIYFNGTGGIDVYSKTGDLQGELLKYLWYPTEAQQAAEGAGCDEYVCSGTVGLGGYSLWDGEKEVKLKGEGDGVARVGKTKKGHFAEVIAYGVQYKGESVDVSIRIDVFNGKRDAKVTARELNGKKVQFLTGVNYQKGAILSEGKGYVAAWGVHPPNVSLKPIPCGGGVRFKPSKFSKPEQTDKLLRIISKPCSKISTTISHASTRDNQLDSPEKFFDYLR